MGAWCVVLVQGVVSPARRGGSVVWYGAVWVLYALCSALCSMRRARHTHECSGVARKRQPDNAGVQWLAAASLRVALATGQAGGMAVFGRGTGTGCNDASASASALVSLEGCCGS